jgi:hypothetical protein
MSPPAEQATGPTLPSGLVPRWWLLGWLLFSVGSAELLAAALQTLALSQQAGPEDSCPWCGACCWETLWQAQRPRRADAAAAGVEGDDSSRGRGQKGDKRDWRLLPWLLGWFRGARLGCGMAAGQSTKAARSSGWSWRGAKRATSRRSEQPVQRAGTAARLLGWTGPLPIESPKRAAQGLPPSGRVGGCGFVQRPCKPPRLAALGSFPTFPRRLTGLSFGRIR